ncbi:MAG: hypothetical protein AAF649_01795 [Verrucomicrobiota bacterium]
MNVWIQHHNFDSENISDPSLEGAIQAFTSFNWAAEISSEEVLRNKDKPCCPAGIGFVHTDKTILHICPKNSTFALLHYHYHVPTKLLGFINHHIDENFCIMDFPLRQMRLVLELHYNGDRAKLLDKLNEFEESR